MPPPTMNNKAPLYCKLKRTCVMVSLPKCLCFFSRPFSLSRVDDVSGSGAFDSVGDESGVDDA